jgi:hypothetical protein
MIAWLIVAGCAFCLIAIIISVLDPQDPPSNWIPPEGDPVEDSDD